MKKRCAAAAIALMLVIASGCSKKQEGAPEEAAVPEVSGAAERAYEAAEQYGDIYEEIYTGGGLKLTEAQEERIIERLGSKGCTATMQYGGIAPANTAAVSDFVADCDAGRDAELDIYELCPDAGFLCHTFSLSGGKLTVTRTRLAWIADDGTRFQGNSPTVTYSDSYDVTTLYIENGWLCYDYDVPDNPPGSKHDGHIDTFVRLWIGTDS